ncbi:YbjN domain-containing protein [Nonomuraea sp. NPDC050536]|uniref:YbjN domain-containing protein n=1 Tax=Nonomuraea sp. NPDC050536 TaxID=3364366 RepID=UPI0037CC0D71
MNDQVDPRDVVEAALKASEVSFEEVHPGAFLVTLPGRRKLATTTWLVVGERAMLVEAFFCRQPDENHAEFYRFLLSKNGGMYGVHFCLDPVGDVYMVGRLPLAAVTEDEVDRLLGCVLTYSDEWFNRALELGFASTIKREWEWRASRGESLKNLQAFAHFADPDRL